MEYRTNTTACLKNKAVLKGIETKANDFEQIKNKVIKPCNCCIALFCGRSLEHVFTIRSITENKNFSLCSGGGKFTFKDIVVSKGVLLLTKAGRILDWKPQSSQKLSKDFTFCV